MKRANPTSSRSVLRAVAILTAAAGALLFFTFVGGRLSLILYGILLSTKERESSRQFALSLPGEIVVQVHERVRENWDDTIYDYQLSHAGKPIASLSEWNGPMQFSTGTLDDAASTPASSSPSTAKAYGRRGSSTANASSSAFERER